MITTETIGLIAAGAVLFGVAVYGLFRKKSPTPSVTAPKVNEVSAVTSLDQKLGKTRESFLDHLTQFWGRNNLEGLSSDEWSQVEEALLAADVGYGTAQRLINSAREQIKVQKSSNLKELLRQASGELFSSSGSGAFSLESSPKPLVISVVGINGAGKTTTVGKLAQQFKDSGKTVLLGAVDTFRAGAISQLKVWADRTGAQFVTGREGADPGAVAFDSVSAGKARGADVVLLDTAGRLHTKSNLMEELKKIHRVIKKVIPEAPHETWLVIDGTLGQNSLVQAKEFRKALDLTGIIVTKLDGTAKGGAILAIASELNLPIRYIGLGESVEDLTPFESRAFIDAILG